MKLPICLVLSVLLFAGCSSRETSNDKLTAAEVEVGISEMMQGINDAAGHKDISAFMSYWSKSDSTLYTRGGKTFIGWDEINTEHDFQFSKPGDWNSDMAEVFVSVLSLESGVATAFNFLSSTAPDGSEQSTWFVLTATVKLESGEWKIVQAHASYPGGEDPTPRGWAKKVD